MSALPEGSFHQLQAKTAKGAAFSFDALKGKVVRRRDRHLPSDAKGFVGDGRGVYSAGVLWVGAV
jgi:hypothetical protein